MLLKCGAGEDSWESLGQQGDQHVNLKGNQSWIFIGRTDVEAEAPELWPANVKDDSLENLFWCQKRLTAKGEEGGRGRDG